MRIVGTTTGNMAYALDLPVVTLTIPDNSGEGWMLIAIPETSSDY
jgi:hypothetical protein